MAYLALQILLFLIASVVLGFIIGWWLKTMLFRTATRNLALADGGRAGMRDGSQLHQTELEQLRDEAARARTTIAERNRELAELREALANAWTRSDDSPLENLREKLSASERDRQACEDQLKTLRAQMATLGAQAQAPQSSAGVTAPPDDLKMISGIGAKLEATLNELGIRHFRQIAEFTPERVTRINERLRFKGRIERERWVEQARQLVEGGDTGFSARYKANQPVIDTADKTEGNGES